MLEKSDVERQISLGDTEFPFADDLGPLKVIHVYDPAIELKGVLVVDNVAAGPAIGGLRIAEDVSSAECFRLARAMTLKNAAAGLPHGGGKSVVWGDPKMDDVKKEILIRAFACALKGEENYIFGPDMGTNEQAMAWVKDEINRSVGLPSEVGGIPLDELGATGFGLRAAAKVAEEFGGPKLNGARIVVQGFGSVGKNVARFLAEEGCVLVGASDSRGTIHNPKGLNIKTLLGLKEENKSVTEYSGGETLNRDAVVDLECDIWIPAARPDVLSEDNVERLKTRMVLQGANIPATPGSEKILADKGILNIPDFIANAGGVICAAMEYAGATRSGAFDAISEKITHNTRETLRRAKENRTLPREAAIEMATERARAAMTTRRWTIF